jgi:hypothetical protein
MWPFKKKKITPKLIENKFTSTICIPGMWKDWNEFILAVVDATHCEYIAAGNVLMNAKKEKAYTTEFCSYDERMRNSFSYAGITTGVTESFLDKIAEHNSVIYISGSTGNMEDAAHIAFAAGAVLKAGGLGVKVETAGKAFDKVDWLEKLDHFKESDLYQMFVVDSLLKENGEVFSCGMQNLGYKDTILSGEEFQKAAALVKLFGIYQLVDKPTILHGQTFSAELESPRFRITHEDEQPYKNDELFGNPLGMWRLTKE